MHKAFISIFILLLYFLKKQAFQNRNAIHAAPRNLFPFLYWKGVALAYKADVDTVHRILIIEGKIL